VTIIPSIATQGQRATSSQRHGRTDGDDWTDEHL